LTLVCLHPNRDGLVASEEQRRLLLRLARMTAAVAEPPPELPMGDVETLVVSCNKDGMDRLRQGDLKAAFEQFKYAEAILLANQMEGDSTALLATTCNNLGCYYKKVGKFHGALGYLRRALKLEVELKTDEVTLAGTHLNLCAVLSKLEKHDKALQHSLVALEMLSKKIEVGDNKATQDDYTILSIAYHNVGLEREHMQQWDQATIAFRTGYEVAKRFLGEGHALTVTLLNNSNAVLKKSKDLQEQPGCTGPKARSFQQPAQEEHGAEQVTDSSPGTVTLPPIVKKDAPSRGRNADPADFLKNEELLWASFAAKTLRNTGPAIEDDLPQDGDEEDQNDEDDHLARHPLNKAALVSMQDLGLILPQAYDQGLFRFQEDRGKVTNHNALAKAMNDHPKALMDIIDAEGDQEPSMSAPNDFRPNRSMKRSTRTSKVVRRTGVFNSTTFRDKVMEDRLRLANGGKTASAHEQNAAASIIQITWRNWHKYLQDNAEWITVTWICATMIQSHWRSYHVRRVKLDKMVTNIQKIARGVLVRRAMRQHRAAVTIQKRVVGILTRKRMKALHQTATTVQRLARGFLARRRYQRFYSFKVSKVVCIERFCRAWLAKKRIAEKREVYEKQRVLDKASIDLQRLYRGWKGRAVAFARYAEATQAKLEYDSATKLQSMYRAKKARRNVDIMRDQRLKEMEAAATFLRKMWLGVQTRNQYLKLKRDFERAEKKIVIIQRYTRGCMCRIRLWRDAVEKEEKTWAAIEIQRRWRGYRGRVHWEATMENIWRREMAAALLQRNLRGWVARAKIARRKRKAAREEFEKARRRFFAAQCIQKRIRGILARRMVHYRLARVNHAAAKIQSVHRGGMVRSMLWDQVRGQRAILAQAAARGFLVRRRMRKLKQKVIFIQKIYRHWRSLPKMRRLVHIRAAVLRKRRATVIQRYWRQHAESKRVKEIMQQEREKKASTAAEGEGGGTAVNPGTAAAPPEEPSAPTLPPMPEEPSE